MPKEPKNVDRRTVTVSLKKDEESQFRGAMRRDGMTVFSVWVKSVLQQYADGELRPRKSVDDVALEQRLSQLMESSIKAYVDRKFEERADATGEK